ncbi:iron chelate uptake ABC transporter family permease subunit [Mycoplasmoides alvi]|uniref:iron chelate uptake ABC transporter family permease subunit n=1 Tax=Mycoplasmoides alvi TaxID=78580 RepID=UPI00051C75EE|nr:iron chelate uptake ABC transporter family permease subunit [Mycoplasmoides alvi]
MHINNYLKFKSINKKQCFLSICFLFIFLLLFTIFLFFNPSTLSLDIPYGPNANFIWNSRIQLALKLTIGSSAIGLSNYLFQLFTKNKLADISIMGINTFQQIVVALFILFATNFFLIYEQSFIFSFIYLSISILSGVIFYFISWRNDLSSKNIFIYGILLNILVTALSYFILSSNVVDQDTYKDRVIYYQNKVFGNLVVSDDFSNLYVSSILLVFCFIWTFCLRLKFMAKTFMIQKTNTLGINNKWINLNLILLVSILSSIAFGFFGIIAFIGVSVSFISNKLFFHFKYNVLGSILISIILMFISQYAQIIIANLVSSFSLTTIVGFISCLIFMFFLWLNR